MKAENAKSMQYTENRRKIYKNSDLTNTTVYEYADIHETGFNSLNTLQGKRAIVINLYTNSTIKRRNKHFIQIQN